jgi:hypothetical protein
MPRPIGLQSRCSIHHGISDPLALLFCPTRAVLPQTPTPQTHRIFMGGALKARDPQTFTISTRPRPSPPGLHSPAGAPSHWAVFPSPAWSLLWWPCPQSLHSTAQYSLCKAVPLRPAKPGTHTHMISILLHHAPQACQARDPLTCRISTLMACTLQACQVHVPKAGYFTSAKGLHLKAHGTPPTIHLPQEGSKPT